MPLALWVFPLRSEWISSLPRVRLAHDFTQHTQSLHSKRLYQNSPNCSPQAVNMGIFLSTFVLLLLSPPLLHEPFHVLWVSFLIPTSSEETSAKAMSLTPHGYLFEYPRTSTHLPLARTSFLCCVGIFFNTHIIWGNISKSHDPTPHGSLFEYPRTSTHLPLARTSSLCCVGIFFNTHIILFFDLPRKPSMCCGYLF